MEVQQLNCTLRHEFCFLLSGPTRCGKSTLAREILLQSHEIIDTPIKQIVYCYGVDQPKYFAALKNEIPYIIFIALSVSQ